MVLQINFVLDMIIMDMPCLVLNVAALELADKVTVVEDRAKDRINLLAVQGRLIVEIERKTADVLILVYAQLVARVNLKRTVVKRAAIPEVKGSGLVCTEPRRDRARDDEVAALLHNAVALNAGKRLGIGIDVGIATIVRNESGGWEVVVGVALDKLPLMYLYRAIECVFSRDEGQFIRAPLV